MTDSAKEFLMSIQKDELLKVKIDALTESVKDKDPEQAQREMVRKTLALANERGYDLVKEDFEMSKEALSDTEMEAVAGGQHRRGTCQCVLGGSGSGEYTCSCTFSGLGYKNGGGTPWFYSGSYM